MQKSYRDSSVSVFLKTTKLLMAQKYLPCLKSSQNTCGVDFYRHSILTALIACKYDKCQTGAFLLHYSEIDGTACEV